MLFVQGRAIENASVSARNELVCEMRPVVEDQSRPSIGTAWVIIVSIRVQPNAKQETRRSMSHDATKVK